MKNHRIASALLLVPAIVALAALCACRQGSPRGKGRGASRAQAQRAGQREPGRTSRPRAGGMGSGMMAGRPAGGMMGGPRGMMNGSQGATGAPTKSAPKTSGYTKVGSARCADCHGALYRSWEETPHAKAGVDCESCHGPGSGYAYASVMKAPARAEAAGLVVPGKQFCMKCHAGNWKPGMLQAVHAR